MTMACRFICRSFNVNIGTFVKLKYFNRVFSTSHISFSKNETKRQLQDELTAYEKADATNRVIAKSIDPAEYFKWERQGTDQQEASSCSHKSHVSMPMSDFIECYENLSPGEILKDISIGVAGGIHYYPSAEDPEEDEKVFSYDLYGKGVKIKIIVDTIHYVSEEELFKLDEKVDSGDILECIGYPAKTKEGDLSIVLTCFNVLGPSPTNLSTSFLRDKSLLQPLHLDLMLNAHQNIILRPKVYKYIHKFLTKMNFEECIDCSPDSPFVPFSVNAIRTDCNDLGLSFYRRPNDHPECYLTKLQRGCKRIYELGYVCRYDVTGFTPELAICELYMCDTESNKLMEFIETFTSGIVKTINGSYHISYHFEGKEYEIDFTPPFKRIQIVPELESAMGEKLSEYFNTPEAKKKLLDLCMRYELKCPPAQTTSTLLDKLVKHFLGEKLINPTFLCNHPIIGSPFDKYCKTIHDVAKRFEMFSVKQKIANAYTLLNDSKVQLEKFKAQDKFDDKYMNFINEIFSTILKHGHGPIASCGVNIDGLLMLLRNSTDIKNVQFHSSRRLSAQDVNIYHNHIEN